jgi:hypothetical protein
MPRKTSSDIEAKIEPGPQEYQYLKAIAEINLKKLVNGMFIELLIGWLARLSTYLVIFVP